MIKALVADLLGCVFIVYAILIMRIYGVPAQVFFQVGMVGLFLIVLFGLVVRIRGGRNQ